MLAVEALEPHAGLRAPEELRLGTRHHLQVPVPLPAQRVVGFARLDESVARVLPHRLQLAVARLVSLGVRDQQGLVHEPREKVEHRVVLHRRTRADRFRGVQRSASHEDRQATQHRSLVLREQVVAPVDRLPQRLVARDGDAAGAGQEAKPIVEAGGDLLAWEGTHPGSGELQRPGHAVETTTDLPDRRGVARGDPEIGGRRHRALDEEPD